MNYAWCSCGAGWGSAHAGLAVFEAELPLVVMTMVRHWRDGHRLTARGEAVPMIRAAAERLAARTSPPHQSDEQRRSAEEQARRAAQDVFERRRARGASFGFDMDDVNRRYRDAIRDELDRKRRRRT